MSRAHFFEVATETTVFAGSATFLVWYVAAKLALLNLIF